MGKTIYIFTEDTECFAEVNYRSDIGEREEGTTETTAHQEMSADLDKIMQAGFRVSGPLAEHVLRAAQLPGSSGAYGIPPVSYTHLDVYKRQHVRLNFMSFF